MSLPAIFGTDPEAAAQASFERLRCLSDGLVRAIGIARALTESGRRVDLAGFTDAIGRLCAGALDLPPATGRTARPLLIEVLLALDHVGAAIRPTEEASAPLAS